MSLFQNSKKTYVRQIIFAFLLLPFALSFSPFDLPLQFGQP